MSRRTVHAAVLSGVVLLPTYVQAQDVSLDLSLPTPTAVVTLQVPATGGVVRLALVRMGADPVKAANVSITPFLSEGGERLVPLLTAGDGAAQPVSQLDLQVGASPSVAVNLNVPAFHSAGPYRGSLFVTVEGAKPVRQAVAIVASTPPRPGALQLAPETDLRTVVIAMPFWRSRYSPPGVFDPSLGPAFELRLNDAAGRWPLTNVEVGPVIVTKAPEGFSFSEHAAFYAGDTLAKPPFRVPAAGMTLRLQLGGLRAGEYSMIVPFSGDNVSTEPRKTTLVVQARHHVGYAVACLLASLLLSFIASKLISIRNERVRLLDRVSALRPFWLQGETPTMAVVWVQSITEQARQLSERHLLPSLETIHKRLDIADTLLQAIERLRRVRIDIEQSALPRFAKARALKIAQRIGDRLDPEMESIDFVEVTTAITDLRAWTRLGEATLRYATDLATSVDQLLAEVDVPALPPQHRPAISALVTELKKEVAAESAELEERERTYATLKILWERRTAPEFAELLALGNGGIDAIFHKADESAWERLKAQPEDRRCIKLTSHRHGSQADADDPLTFAFTAGDDSLDATFLVQHGLIYEWRFTLVTKAGEVPLTPTTRGPLVPLVAPFAGALNPTVTLVHGAQTLTVVKQPVVRVNPSRVFTLRNSFSSGEVLQLTLAFVVAVITGLQTFYYKAQGFGSLADYMALFAWGATIDQVKNFLRQSAPTATPAATTVTAQAGSTTGSQAAAEKPAAEKPAAEKPAVPAKAAAAPEGGAPVPQAPVPDIPDPQTPASLNLGNVKKD